MAADSEEIKQLVRERYGAKARSVVQLTDISQPVWRRRQAAAVQGTWNRPSGYIERVNWPVCQPSRSPHLPAAATPRLWLGFVPGERVLDLGSGGGIDCFLAAQQVGGTGHVFGLDMTPDMLSLARQNQAKLGLTNVEFVKGEMEDMPLPDSSVDVIISNCVVCLSPDKDAVFRESFRVLAPGGRIHLSDMMSLTQEGPGRTDAEAWASCIAGAEHQEVYLGRLRSAGFTDVEIEAENVPFDETDENPLNVASVKVVARKPG